MSKKSDHPNLSMIDNPARLFGKPGSPYDFSGADVGLLKEKARELETQQKGMKKKVNPKVINMIDT